MPGTYLGISVDKIKFEVSDEEVQEEIDYFLQSQAELIEVEGRNTVEALPVFLHRSIIRRISDQLVGKFRNQLLLDFVDRYNIGARLPEVVRIIHILHLRLDRLALADQRADQALLKVVGMAAQLDIAARLLINLRPVDIQREIHIDNIAVFNGIAAFNLNQLRLTLEEVVDLPCAGRVR